MNLVVLENIRSAYNVGNIIRTADALGYGVVISGYTPSAFDEKVIKTSLGAEKTVPVIEFWNPRETLEYLRNNNYKIICAEITSNSIGILDLKKNNNFVNENIAIVMGNEVEGVLKETLESCDWVVHLPMVGKKESLNVGQAAAIFMWEIKK